MTRIGLDSIVVYEVALCSHPLSVGEDDDRTDEQLIEDVAERTTVEGMKFPAWTVMVSDPPDMERIRYVNTAQRINIKAQYDTIDPFEEIEERLTIEDYYDEDTDNMDLSHWGATHIEDFDGTVHLDLS